MKPSFILITLALIGLLYSGHSHTFAPKPVEEDKPGCFKNFCLGDRVYIKTHKEFANVHVLNKEAKTITLQLEDSKAIAAGFLSDDLMYSSFGYCGEHACVGEEVYDLEKEAFKRILGIERSFGAERYLLIYNTRMWWSDPPSFYHAIREISALASTNENACYANICVGDKAYYKKNHNKSIKILAISKQGDIVIQYIESDQIYSITGDASDFHVYFSAKEAKRIEKEKNEILEALKSGLFDIALYETLKKEGLAHSEALEKAMGPILTDLNGTSKFLVKLATHLYRFDSDYLLKINSLIGNDFNSEKKSLFILNALSPFLKNLGYSSIRENYGLPALNKTEEINKQFHLQHILNIEATTVMKNTALQMLAFSLVSSQSQMSGAQKEASTILLKILSDVLATKLQSNDMEIIRQSLPKFESLILELSQNPYLQSRAATDMLLLEYLKNS